MRKKRIVCFGDSNTWGYDPVTHTRYDESVRWPMVLQALLGDAYQIIEEGQNGRTIANPDPWEWGTKCGMDYVLPMVETHNPFDLLIIMLGSNDLKRKFSLPAADIAGSLQNMLMKVRGYAAYQLGCPDLKILIVSPPALGSELQRSPFAPFLTVHMPPRRPRSWPAGTHWWPSSFIARFSTPRPWFPAAKRISCTCHPKATANWPKRCGTKSAKFWNLPNLLNKRRKKAAGRRKIPAARFLSTDAQARAARERTGFFLHGAK